MGALSRMVATVRGTVRYKLLVLVLFPILLVMPIALGLAIYWGANFTYDQLFIKVNTDLSVSHDAFERIREGYLDRLGRLAESYAARTALKAGDAETIDKQLQVLKSEAGFSYLQVLSADTRLLFQPQSGYLSRPSPSLKAAVKGWPGSGVEIFSNDELARIDKRLAASVRLPLIETQRARPSRRTTEDQGMMIRALYPVMDVDGQVLAIYEGGVLLNGNFEFVDTIRDLVYGPGSLPEGSIGTVTVFLDDVRISTNVPLRPGERALGTRVSDEVRSRVLDEGRTWIDRAFVVNDWYISSYEPITDVDGRRVGMLYAGYLEEPFREALWQALAAFVLLFVVLMLLSALVAVQGAKSIFRPLELMSRVVRATRAGEERRIGQVQSRDEIGELAREFDAMLDLLHEHSQQIQQWADQLEDKVAERTEELEHKNADLRRTIRVLRQTRQQLVVAEKLAALGELTAGVAHEINNPTQVMLGNLDILVAELGEASEPVQAEIELIVQQIYRIREIINNLLQYARPSEYAGYLGDVDCNSLIHETLKLVQHLRNRYAFDVALDLEAELPIQINQQELQQVLVNLIVNAVHALPELGGHIHISSRDWEDKGVVVRVRDNGAGMDDDQIGRVFNPFYSTKGQGEGTGLGLSLSYSLVRRYGGNITVSSAPGEGSEFAVWLLTRPELVEDEQTIAEQLHAIESEANETEKL